MHILCGVVVPMDTTLDNAHQRIEPLMAPYCEEPPPDHHWNEDGWWDWWMIGGRFTGRYSEYDPRQDPANHEVCRLCAGSGERSDGRSGPGNCNGCCAGSGDLTGTGSALLWPSQWKPCPDDVVPIKVLVNNPTIGLPIRIVFPDGSCSEEGPWKAEEREQWNRGMAERLAEYVDMALVVVDVHA